MIAYDMFLIAGGKPWEAVGAQPPFCSIDAGHSRSLNRSLWVKVESDAQQRICDAKAIFTSLAEHIPHEYIDELWPSHSDAIACRDGKLSQERHTLEARALRENRPLLEVKKSPKAVLWREAGGDLCSAEFGDAIEDEHGEVLLQTMPQDLRDYIRPVRISAKSRAQELSTLFLQQHAMPGLSMFRMSKLPGTLYFADLISKQTTDGWPKVIGRGFQLPQIVP